MAEVARIPLRARDGSVKAWAVVEADDLELVSGARWHLFDGYARRNVRMRTGRWVAVMMHRLICGLEHGDPRQPDHIDLDRLNNRRSNLMIVTPAQQRQNQSIRVDNSTGFRGVSYHKGTGKWQAYGQIDGRKKWLGVFETREQANHVVTAWRRENMSCSAEARAA